ncbi:MAG: PASTA domain-containing protein [Oscillospiraceae bacterium]|nr:PASTA domain-containing protein [Oscillospiraceae bacterium]
MAHNKVNKGGRPPDKKMLSRTLILMLVCGLAAFSVLIGRLFYLQIIKHSEYEALAIEQQLRETVLDNGRGTIYDRNMNILAISADVETIYISPAEIAMHGEDANLIAEGLSEILGVSREKILEMSEDTSSWYKTVARRVEADVAEKVREFKNEYSLKGIKIEADTKRYYPYGSLASHVIGYTGYENIGLSGMELSLDNALSGEKGRVVKIKNAYGTDMLYTKFEEYIAREEGRDAVLTIDSSIQYYLEKHLKQAIADYDIQNGAAAIAMDVNTGEILGMASMGNFDPNNYQLLGEKDQQLLDEVSNEEEKENLRATLQQKMWRNKAISDTYEPGSTFKIITLAMALEEGLVGENEHFYCGGRISVIGDAAGKGRKCWKTTGHGDQTLTQCMQHSCNVALIQIGQRVGADKFYDYVEAFGLFDESGIELGGEADSLWWNEEIFCDENNLTQLAAASFGQTFTITPLQLIRAVSACVNGGKLVQPHFVKGFVDDSGKIISTDEQFVSKKVLSESTSESIREILEQVVCDTKEGTGKNAYVAGYRIGGKTGTSTKTVLEADGTKEYIVSFIGFAPADEPEICILVLLDNPSSKTGLYISGGNMAAPTVGKMFADILPCMGIMPVYTEEEKELMDKVVPDVVGLSLGEAEKIIKETGFSCEVRGEGEYISDMLPSPGNAVASKSQILLYLGDSKQGNDREVPSLIGLSYAEAVAKLAYNDLYASTDFCGLPYDETILVSEQEVIQGTMVKAGEVIELELIDVDTAIYGLY